MLTLKVYICLPVISSDIRTTIALKSGSNWGITFVPWQNPDHGKIRINFFSKILWFPFMNFCNFYIIEWGLKKYSKWEAKLKNWFLSSMKFLLKNTFFPFHGKKCPMKFFFHFIDLEMYLDLVNWIFNISFNEIDLVLILMVLFGVSVYSHSYHLLWLSIISFSTNYLNLFDLF